jgi:hypothetical protein
MLNGWMIELIGRRQGSLSTRGQRTTNGRNS